MTIHQDPHPQEGQIMILRSDTPELDGRAAKIGRLVKPDELNTTVKHSNDFLRRFIVRGIGPTIRIFQVTLVQGPNDPSMSPGFDPDYRTHNSIWVTEDEITITPYNKHNNSPTAIDVEKYLQYPKLCLYKNCISDYLTIVGVGLRNGDHETKIECGTCYGTWIEQWTITGIKEKSYGK